MRIKASRCHFAARVPTHRFLCSHEQPPSRPPLRPQIDHNSSWERLLAAPCAAVESTPLRQSYTGSQRVRIRARSSGFKAKTRKIVLIWDMVNWLHLHFSATSRCPKESYKGLSHPACTWSLAIQSHVDSSDRIIHPLTHKFTHQLVPAAMKGAA